MWNNQLLRYSNEEEESEDFLLKVVPKDSPQNERDDF